MWVSHQTEMFDLMERIIKRWREGTIKHMKINHRPGLVLLKDKTRPYIYE